MDKNLLEARIFFETLYRTYNNKNYIATDPVRFPHELEGNKEFVAFTASCFAYGNMKAIQGFLSRYFAYAGTDPLSINCVPDEKLYYRFQSYKDVAAYSALMKRIYSEYGSLEELFKAGGAFTVDTADRGIKLLRSYMKEITHGMNFLVPTPGKSASKRLYMFLRWMIRKDEVDFGFWSSFNKTSLYMPSDTHILRMAANMGVISKNEAGRTAVLKVTEFFRRMNPEDPAKYDFALTRLGIVTGCQYSQTLLCQTCAHNRTCLFN